MTVNKISNVYSTNSKQNGDTLSGSEWTSISSAVNVAQTKVNEIIDNLGNAEGSGNGSSIVSLETDTLDSAKQYIKVNNLTVAELTDKGTKGINIAVSGNNNINIEPRPAVGTGEGKNNANDANRKGGNISLKPGDDIELCSHKRGTGKNTEVAVKAIDGSDNPVKLQIFAGDITLSTKGKDKTKAKDATGEDTTDALYDDPNVMNINVTTGEGKGYLKVRAQAIDLRCEDHGGIAIQPKGQDNDGHINKIKFEHGGGDGLEFGTFNTEKTSIFTDEYRFNKNGVWKMSTRNKVNSKWEAFVGLIGYTDPDGTHTVALANPFVSGQKYKSAEILDMITILDKSNLKEFLKSNSFNIVFSDKTVQFTRVQNDDTTAQYTYLKADDDFYDNIASTDATATTENIIDAARFMFNHSADILNEDSNDMSIAYTLYDMRSSDRVGVYDANTTVSNDNYINVIEVSDASGVNPTLTEAGIGKLVSDILNGTGSNLSADVRKKTASAITSGEPFILRSGEEVGRYTYSYPYVAIPSSVVYKNSGNNNAEDVSFSDIIRVTQYMKMNNQGPWANA